MTEAFEFATYEQRQQIFVPIMQSQKKRVATLYISLASVLYCHVFLFVWVFFFKFKFQSASKSQ